MTSGERASRFVFFGVSALLFAASAALTILLCTTTSAMCHLTGHMATAIPPSPGSLSDGCIRMPGQTWPGAAASFLGMWAVMMVAMMLPSLIPMLWRYRQTVGSTGETHLGRLTVLVGAGYFFVWTVVGMAAFPLVAALDMQQLAPSRGGAIAVDVVVAFAGALQFTTSKARHLACFRGASASARLAVAVSYGKTSPKPPPPAETGPGRHCTWTTDAEMAWRYGMRLGLHCLYCCANLMAIILVSGVMDLRAMGLVTAVITSERLAPAGECVARAIGAVLVGSGLLQIVRAGLG